MKRRLLVLLSLVLALASCTDRALVRDASAAYQYQKGVYQHECPLPPKPRSKECEARDAQLTDDVAYVSAAVTAVELSKGGKLPKSARTKLKVITKELQ